MVLTFHVIFHMYPLLMIQEVLKMYSFWQKANRYRLGNTHIIILS